ncbi:unnamed protein product [Vitrella brassicaformis CCMP3155]|uniref:ILEI/PANDER domain-containing protein n=2 Tax=Vitrella brassicaformis TaxID=1169539 RepID=A0A0G4FEE3_VITBC|nr:unnamed protein product [Vitrella brassicaformis CCMP3155]|eukprot:CEM11582.1 unnamed protein product [Vitrella brassicaformis CCMP3155]
MGAGLWTTPQLHAFDPVRAGKDWIHVSWTAAFNPWAELHSYELQVRTVFGSEQTFNCEYMKNRNELHANYEGCSNIDWGPWVTVYTGTQRLARATGFNYTNPDNALEHRWELLLPGAPYWFRVRAVGKGSSGTSAWSAQLVAFTQLNATQDRFNIYLRGTGRNNPAHAIIQVDGRRLYERMDERGLVLAVFDRTDFELASIETFDTFGNRTAAYMMAQRLNQFDQRYVVLVVSVDAWEAQVSLTLARELALCGAYHLQSFPSVHSEKTILSPYSDADQSASSKGFGHPYAFIGIPGLGTGAGWEAIQYPTGHYRRSGLTPHAEIRATVYYDYVTRMFRIAPDVLHPSAGFFLGASPPQPSTLHNPMPTRPQNDTNQTANGNNVSVLAPHSLIRNQPPIPYEPYVSTVRQLMPLLLEANETNLQSRNRGYEITTVAGVHVVDPRPLDDTFTELEALWGGPSRRELSDPVINMTQHVTDVASLQPMTSANNDTFFVVGIPRKDRACYGFVREGYFNPLPPAECASYAPPTWPVTCCTPDQADRARVELFRCGTGLTPKICYPPDVSPPLSVMTVIDNLRFHVRAF